MHVIYSQFTALFVFVICIGLAKLSIDRVFAILWCTYPAMTRRAADVLTEYSVRCKHSGRRDLHLISDSVRSDAAAYLVCTWITLQMQLQRAQQRLCIALSFYFNVNSQTSKYTITIRQSISFYKLWHGSKRDYLLLILWIINRTLVQALLFSGLIIINCFLIYYLFRVLSKWIL